MYSENKSIISVQFSKKHKLQTASQCLLVSGL